MKASIENAASILKKVLRKENISREETVQIFKDILDHRLGEANDATFGALFAALQTKGPTVEEIQGLTEVVLEYDRVSIPYPGDINELNGIVGSGKDDLKTFNVSTCAAIVAASAGAKVVKNGSRSESSTAGTTDVLEYLGFPIHQSSENIVAMLEKTNLTFCDAEPYFPRMGKEYVGKFIFPHPLSYTLSIASGLSFGNILFGVSFDDTELVAQVIKGLGMNRFIVAAGHDEQGNTLDEISTLGPTKMSECVDGTIKTYTFSPTDIGIPIANFSDVRQGQNVAENASRLKAVLNGTSSDAARQIVCVNAGALLYVSGKADSIADGFKIAENSIKQGLAQKKFEEVIAFGESSHE